MAIPPSTLKTELIIPRPTQESPLLPLVNIVVDTPEDKIRVKITPILLEYVKNRFPFNALPIVFNIVSIVPKDIPFSTVFIPAYGITVSVPALNQIFNFESSKEISFIRPIVTIKKIPLELFEEILDCIQPKSRNVEIIKVEHPIHLTWATLTPYDGARTIPCYAVEFSMNGVIYHYAIDEKKRFVRNLQLDESSIHVETLPPEIKRNAIQFAANYLRIPISDLVENDLQPSLGSNLIDIGYYFEFKHLKGSVTIFMNAETKAFQYCSFLPNVVS